MIKKFGISMVLILMMVFTLTACSNEKPVVTQDQPSTEVVEETETESSDAVWPEKLMGNMPVPECEIVSVYEYDASSMSGELVVVNYSDMSKEFAEKYMGMLTELGFVDGVSVVKDDKMIFSGTAPDKSAVNFDYDAKTQGGNISYKPAP